MKLSKYFRYTALLAIVLTGVFCMCMRVQAYSRLDVGRETSLSVFFGEDGKGFSGAEFRIYRVADVSDTVRYTLTETFEKYQISLEGLDSSGWRAAAETLSAYIARDSIAPEMTEITDQTGYAEFGSLNTGLYLVEGNPYKANGYTYWPESCLVSLPALDEEEDEWVYNVNAVCKYEKVPESQGTVSKKVIKIWEDGNESVRPEEVGVQLLRDGVVIDTVKLNKENNWQYTWTDLDDQGRWQITEYRIPERYTVSVVREGTCFIMTNTLQASNPAGRDEVLPQTGVLWWPVSLLAGTGMILFLAGWKKYNG